MSQITIQAHIYP